MNREISKSMMVPMEWLELLTNNYNFQSRVCTSEIEPFRSYLFPQDTT